MGSLKAANGSTREPNFMQNLDEMVLQAKAKQRGSRSSPAVTQPSANVYTPSGAMPPSMPDAGGGAAAPVYAPGGVGMQGDGVPYNGSPAVDYARIHDIAGGAASPMLVNDASPRRSSKAASKGGRHSKSMRAPLPMCVEGDDENGTVAMMTVVVDTQSPPASIEKMPDFPKEMPMPGPPSAGYVDVEAMDSAISKAWSETQPEQLQKPVQFY